VERCCSLSERERPEEHERAASLWRIFAALSRAVQIAQQVVRCSPRYTERLASSW